ncbi:hypothetical protein Csa_001555 [Cucumis sativus]|nr:hypothetical protein Csa_001555 [Cucumis sativus]
MTKTKPRTGQSEPIQFDPIHSSPYNLPPSSERSRRADDGVETFVDGESSPPGGRSERAARNRRILTERAGLKLRDLTFWSLEKRLEDLERIK